MWPNGAGINEEVALLSRALDAENVALACKIYESVASSGLGQTDPDAEVRRGERSPKTVHLIQRVSFGST